MNKEEYFIHHKNFIDRMSVVTAAKNHDYTGATDDPFANFRRCEQLGVCSAEQGFLVRMTDKLARITSFVQQGNLQVKDESVQDTLLDLANYCALLSGFIESRKPPSNLSQQAE